MTAEKTIAVPVGELRVSANPAETLFTCVGSCVAVALYDSREKIAGLLHIVLPGNRTSVRHDDRNAFYADTGVPLLVREMEQRGAARNRMTAIIAGGACLTPESTVDIGARNSEQTLNLLAAAGILVLRQETGGSEGRAVEIAVNTGETRIRINSRRMAESTTGTVKRAVPLSAVNDLAALLEQMRPDTQIAGKLFEAIHRDEIDWHEIFDLISQDVVLALHLFQKCNSAYFGNPQKVASFASALTCLGPDKLRRVCVVVAAQKNSETGLADFGIDQKIISRHGLASALTAQYLALEMCPEHEKETFTAALLHSIGCIAARLTTADSHAEPDAGFDGCCLFDEEANAESTLYHGQLAAALLVKWDFPQMIVEAISAVQAPPLIQVSITIATIIDTACSISTMLGIGGSSVNKNVRFSLSALEQGVIVKENDRLLANIIMRLRTAGLLQ